MTAGTAAETAAGTMTDAALRRRRIIRRVILGLLLLVQAGSTLFFFWDIIVSFFGLRTVPLSWQLHELIEIGAMLGLVLGMVFGAIAFSRLKAAADIAQARLERAQLAFRDLLEERFALWALTPAERDVALFAIKGMSTSEIADLRGTSEGTVKAQSNAIYRKAGVSGRAQLLGVFIEDLTGDPGVEDATEPGQPALIEASPAQV